jgi:DNA-binding response OmpR family regulator
VQLKRILLVERDPTLLCGLVVRLQSNYAVSAVRTTQAALEMSPEMYDAVVIDPAVAETEGRSFKRELDARLAAVPVILSPRDALTGVDESLEWAIARAVSDSTFVTPT